MLSFLKFLIESTKDFFEAGLEFPKEFKDVYSDLENPETKTFTDKIEAAVSSTNVTFFFLILIWRCVLVDGDSEKLDKKSEFSD